MLEDYNVGTDESTDEGGSLVSAPCRFCGQVVTFRAPIDASPSQMEAEAMGNCDCASARRWRRREGAYNAIRNACIVYAQQDEMTVLSEDALKGLRDACDQIIDGTTIATTMKINDEEQIRLGSRDGEFFCQRKRTIVSEYTS